MKNKHLLIITSSLAIAAGSASAATFQWDGGAGTGNWQTAANWNPDAANTTFNSTTNNRLNVNGTQALIYTAAEGTTVYANTSNTSPNFRGLVIGSGSSGSMTITGGTFSTAGSLTADIIGNSGSNTGTLTINGGNYISGTPGLLLGGGSGNNFLNVQSGTATITTLSINTTLASTTSLTGGTLEVNTITTANVGTYTINLDGGTLKAGAGASGAFMSGLTNAYVKSNGAKIDSNGKNITIAQNLVDFTTPSGGGLTLNDTAVTKGTLTLSGTGNTYTGATTIKAGTLKLNTSTTIASSSSIMVGDTGSSGAVLDTTTAGLTVGSTQTLAGIGKVLATGQTLVINGTISPGDSSTDTLTIDGGALTLNSNSMFAYTLGTSSDLVSLLNSVALSGNSTLNFADFTFTAGTGFGVGIYTLIDNAGSIATLLDSSGLSGTIGGFGATLSTSNLSGNDLILTVVPEPSTALLGSLGVLILLRRRRA